MFKADGEIFETTEYSYEVLLRRLREQAFLNAGIKINFSDKRNKDEIQGEILHYEGGIRQFVEHIHKTRELESISGDVIYISGTQGDSFAEVALQYNDGFNEIILSFANNIHTKDGGSHETGFKNALTKVIKDYETRLAIINRKSELLELKMPSEVAEFMANRLKSNIRQLEGAVVRLKALNHFAGSPITISMAQSVMRDVLADEQPIPITVEKELTWQPLQQAAQEYPFSCFCSRDSQL